MTTSFATPNKIKASMNTLQSLFVLASMEDDMEIWKDVKGYEGIYKVSNFGRVKSLQRKKFIGKYSKSSAERFVLLKEREKKIHIDSLGYQSVCLWKDNLGKTKRIHRLIAEAFIPNEYNHTDIDHINGVKTDNSLSNLRWCSRANNARNSVARGGTSKYKGVFKSKNAWCVQVNHKHIGRFKNEIDAAVAYNKKAKEVYGEYARLNHV